MTRLAVKTFCQQQLALLDVPVPCAVLTQRPREVSVGTQAVLIVTLPEGKEERFAGPRPQGRKQVTYRLGIEVYWLAVDDQDGGASFDQLLDQLDALLRAIPLPAAVTDPQSGAASAILLIGEEIETSVNEPLLLEDLQGYIAFTARKMVQVVEHVTG